MAAAIGVAPIAGSTTKGLLRSPLPSSSPPIRQPHHCSSLFSRSPVDPDLNPELRSETPAPPRAFTSLAGAHPDLHPSALARAPSRPRLHRPASHLPYLRPTPSLASDHSQPCERPLRPEPPPSSRSPRAISLSLLFRPAEPHLLALSSPETSLRHFPRPDPDYLPPISSTPLRCSKTRPDSLFFIAVAGPEPSVPPREPSRADFFVGGHA